MTGLTRRGFLVGATATLGAACVRGPAVKTKQPLITHGIQSGEVSDAGALVWARCDEPARMIVEWDTSDKFEAARRIAGPVVDPKDDHTGVTVLANLPAEQTIAYRVRFERVAARGASAWATGVLSTPRADSFRFAWTGDTCGQGFGRNPDWGGLRGYQAIREAHPRFLLHSGDLIYADDPILAERPLASGGIWKNITNERVGRVAEELDDFRARFAYNLEDEHVARLAAEVPMLAQWDDHETHNNWYPGQQLADPRYTHQRAASALAAAARQAMFEWVPIPRGGLINRVVHYGPLLDVIVLDCRSFRTRNDAPEMLTTSPGASMLGPEQAAWFIQAVARSKARWKIIACDQPVGLVIGDGPEDSYGREGWAGSTGAEDHAPTGREVELAQILRGLQAHGVKNLAWLTADVHYAAAHHYDPARAAFAEFDPFWEFVAGPIHAGTFGPNELDQTFGGEVRFNWAPAQGQGNLPPSDGLQSFGTIDVGKDALEVKLWGIDGKARYTVDLPYVG